MIIFENCAKTVHTQTIEIFTFLNRRIVFLQNCCAGINFKNNSEYYLFKSSHVRVQSAIESTTFQWIKFFVNLKAIETRKHDFHSDLLAGIVSSTDNFILIILNNDLIKVLFN